MTNLPKPSYSGWDAIRLALALARRAIDEIRQLAREPGPKGEKGEPGQPGIGLDVIDIDYDGERTFKFRLGSGSVIAEKTAVVPVSIYQGVYQEGRTYARGDQVTWDGSIWHCKANDMPQVKPAHSEQNVWTLAAKKGRDGRNGIDGKDGKLPTDHIPFGDK